jgi:DNA helicase-2/ATP-dependent DNA helicase PcrA
LPGVGPATAARALDCIAGDDGQMRELAAFKPPAAALADWPAFAEAVRLVRSRAAGWPAELELVCRWYQPHLERIHDDAVLRRADLIQLAQIAQGYPSRERFLTELTLDPPDATSDEAGTPLLDEDYLILSTIHSAKGQEWKSVFVLNTVDGCIPADLATTSKAEIEEERRLLYVAMTRAKDHLHLVVPQRFYAHSQRANGDRHMYAARTRFIPSAILRHFEACAWPVASAAGAAGKVKGEPVDIGARMRRMWK